MNRLQAFLVFDGIVVLGGLLFFLFLYLKRSSSLGNFKEDLWKDTPANRARQKLVDQKILLEQATKDEKGDGNKEKDPFRFPNFRGAPHEVLGIDADASADVINKAFRHWMKKYHPDRVHHLGELYIEQARRRSEQLNNARQKMLSQKVQRP